ncbi:MAG: hypothetical protein OHK0013_28700 [Sandaracinaceae bacterium]
MSDATDTKLDLTGRPLQIVAALVIGVAFMGFFTGTRSGGAPVVWGAAEEPAIAAPASPAPSHAMLGTEEWRWMGARQRAALAAMRGPEPGEAGHEQPAASETERAEALAARARLRAYDGAPPRIPHPAPTRGALPCMSCHAEGLRLATLRAPVMSHEESALCVTCHVQEEAPVPGAEEALRTGPPIDTTFVGLEAPHGGPRAWDGAPPVIPHPTQMRERCASCHGALAGGLRASHPYRQSCVQCHAVSATFDLRPSADLPPPAGGAWTP